MRACRLALLWAPSVSDDCALVPAATDVTPAEFFHVPFLPSAYAVSLVGAGLLTPSCRCMATRVMPPCARRVTHAHHSATVPGDGGAHHPAAVPWHGDTHHHAAVLLHGGDEGHSPCALRRAQWCLVPALPPTWPGACSWMAKLADRARMEQPATEADEHVVSERGCLLPGAAGVLLGGARGRQRRKVDMAAADTEQWVPHGMPYEAAAPGSSESPFLPDTGLRSQSLGQVTWQPPKLGDRGGGPVAVQLFAGQVLCRGNNTSQCTQAPSRRCGLKRALASLLQVCHGGQLSLIHI